MRPARHQRRREHHQPPSVAHRVLSPAGAARDGGFRAPAAPRLQAGGDEDCIPALPVGAELACRPAIDWTGRPEGTSVPAGTLVVRGPEGGAIVDGFEGSVVAVFIASEV